MTSQRRNSVRPGGRPCNKEIGARLQRRRAQEEIGRPQRRHSDDDGAVLSGGAPRRKRSARSGVATATTALALSGRTTATATAHSGCAPRKRCAPTAAARKRRRRPPIRAAPAQRKPAFKVGREPRRPKVPHLERWEEKSKPEAPPYGGAEENIDRKRGGALSLPQDPAAAPSNDGAVRGSARENSGHTRSVQARRPRVGARGQAGPGEEPQTGGACVHPPCTASGGTPQKGVAQGGGWVQWPSQDGTPFERCVKRPLLLSVGRCHTGRVAFRRGECAGLPHPLD